MRTRLTEAFGIQHPIICAPMALITGGRLAAAVSSAGGLGIVGGGYAGTLGGEPDLKQELAHVKGHKFGIGFITWALQRAPHVLDEVLGHFPHFVFLSFGDPRPFAEQIRQSGARLICQVQCLRHVDQAIEAGAAAIVAQGTEAGGHGSLRSTLPFVPEVADYLRQNAPTTLLLAAGGIADGRLKRPSRRRLHRTERDARLATIRSARQPSILCGEFHGPMSSRSESSGTS